MNRSRLKQNAPLFGGEDKMPRRAITMGVGTIIEARRCVLLATGPSKADVIAQAVEGPITSMVTATARLGWCHQLPSARNRVTPRCSAHSARPRPSDGIIYRVTPRVAGSAT